jgi:hypothetical protein
VGGWERGGGWQGARGAHRGGEPGVPGARGHVPDPPGARGRTAVARTRVCQKSVKSHSALASDSWLQHSVTVLADLDVQKLMKVLPGASHTVVNWTRCPKSSLLAIPGDLGGLASLKHGPVF